MQELRRLCESDEGNHAKGLGTSGYVLSMDDTTSAEQAADTHGTSDEHHEDRMERLTAKYAHQARHADALRRQSPEYQAALEALEAASIELCRADIELYANRNEAYSDEYMKLSSDLRDAKFIQREAAAVVYELYREHLISIGEVPRSSPSETVTDDDI